MNVYLGDIYFFPNDHSFEKALKKQHDIVGNYKRNLQNKNNHTL